MCVRAVIGPVCLSRSHTHTHMHTHTFSPTHFLTHTLSLLPSLTPSVTHTCCSIFLLVRFLTHRYLHFLFFGLLIVILYLWRPTLNNQRYAYSLDNDNADDDFEVVPNFQSDAMKQRNVSNRNQPQQLPLLPEEVCVSVCLCLCLSVPLPLLSPPCCFVDF